MQDEKNKSNNFEKYLIPSMLTVIVNSIFLLVCNRLGYQGNYIVFIPIIIYSFIKFYNLTKGKTVFFNTIYGFISSLVSISSSLTDPQYMTAMDNLKKEPVIREFDIKKSKVVYLVGNISFICLLYYLFLVFICKINLDEIVLPLVISVFVFSLFFPLLYSFLYQSLSFKITKIQIIQFILVLILIVISILAKRLFKINLTIVITYFSLLFFLVLSIANKSSFIIMLVIVLFAIILPILFVVLLL